VAIPGAAAETLFSGKRRRARRRPKPFGERRVLGLRAQSIRLLDVAKAANVERHRGKRDRVGVVGGVEIGDDFAEPRLLIANRLALGAALFAAAENIERGPAQEFQPSKQAERRQHPRPVLALP
jgi:hypothetical protein